MASPDTTARRIGESAEERGRPSSVNRRIVCWVRKSSIGWLPFLFQHLLDGFKRLGEAGLEKQVYGLAYCFLFLPPVEFFCATVPGHDAILGVAHQDGVVSQVDKFALQVEAFSEFIVFAFSNALDRHIADRAYHMQSLLHHDGS